MSVVLYLLFTSCLFVVTLLADLFFLYLRVTSVKPSSLLLQLERLADGGIQTTHAHDFGIPSRHTTAYSNRTKVWKEMKVPAYSFASYNTLDQ
jgi:hypothetical protein